MEVHTGKQVSDLRSVGSEHLSGQLSTKSQLPPGRLVQLSAVESVSRLSDMMELDGTCWLLMKVLLP